MENLAEELKKKLSLMNRKEVARRYAISEPTLAKIEKGERVSLKTLVYLDSVLV